MGREPKFRMGQIVVLEGKVVKRTWINEASGGWLYEIRATPNEPEGEEHQFVKAWEAELSE